MTPESELAIEATPELREKFDRDGYLVLESPGFAPELLDSIIAELDGLYEGEPRTEADGVMYSRGRLQDAWKINDNVKALATAPQILKLLEELYGRKPLPFQTLNFPKGTQQSAHSDTLHFNSMPPGYMCGVWVALEDLDMDNGPLIYYPGSHKLPEVTMQDAGLAPERSELKAYSSFIADMIEREGLEPQYATIPKGQAFIWSSNLLHGGSHQRDKSRTRHSQVTHFFFEGCKYYRPLRSDPDNPHWLDPVWVA